MIIYETFVQGSEEWRRARLGMPTASEFDKIITPAKMDFAKGHVKYATQLIAERISGAPRDIESYYSDSMRRGIEGEQNARDFYQMRTLRRVHTCGFVTTDDATAGFSPDGFVVSDGEADWKLRIEGGLEVKMPDLDNYLGYLLERGLPDDFKCQVHGCLALSNLPWWDLLIYCPEHADRPGTIVRTVPNEFTAKLKLNLKKFQIVCAEMETELRRTES